ncbi:MAG: hypothetical protein QGH12_11110, partial [SAR324 cluster bacterium]|nr:hypothetical protein [SAR324 cluster bacterium]
FSWILGFLGLVACAPTPLLTMQTPAEIDTSQIQTVAIGRFEVGHVHAVHRAEREGIWESHELPFSPEQQDAIARTVRARVVNLLTATPYFRVVFTEEFERLENDAALQELISVQGYTTADVDAVISGKIWLEAERIDGLDLSKEDLEYFNPPRAYRSYGGYREDPGLNLNVQQVIWWPYKSVRGTLGLEIKLTQLNPGKVIASTFETRSYAQRIGGKPASGLEQLTAGLQAGPHLVAGDSGLVLPSLDQLVAELSVSIAARFVKRVSLTERRVPVPLAPGSNETAQLLIEVGAYQLAIEQLQQATANDPDPDDLYNLGVCFEAIGDYGLALTSYREAWEKDRENVLFAQGIGRVEHIRRELPQLRRQTQSRKEP